MRLKIQNKLDPLLPKLWTIINLSKGRSASFGSPKLQSARLLSWGEVEVELEAAMEVDMEVAMEVDNDMEVDMALSSAGTLGQVWSLEINLVRAILVYSVM